MIDGQIVQSGNIELVHSIEENGYESWKKES
jgi:Fe-S cluster assembly ATPase SufC